MVELTAVQLGQALRRLRIERAMTRAQVASFAGFGQSIIDRTEKGTQFPRADSLFKWLAALNVMATDFFADLEPHKQDAKGTIQIKIRRQHKKRHEQLEAILNGGGIAADAIAENVATFYRDHVRKHDEQ